MLVEAGAGALLVEAGAGALLWVLVEVVDDEASDLVAAKELDNGWTA